MPSAADAFFAQAATDQHRWLKEMLLLRDLTLATGLQESLKWKQPCYTWLGKNVVLLAPMKDYCALGFFKGTLLDDPDGLLTAPGPNSRHVRQMRFASLEAVEAQAKQIAAFLEAAKALEARGARVAPRKADAEPWPDALRMALAEDAALDHAFRALTPGRQRGYILHIQQAKQATTRSKRVQSHRERILQGKGIHDCVCGLSKRMPRCDGSHKHATPN